VSPQMQRNYQLSNGVKNGSLNRQEFVSLNNYAQQTEKMKAKFLKDGDLSASERAILNSRQNGYDKNFQKYSTGDYHPRTIGTTYEQNKMIGNSNRLYDGLRSGQITNGEGANLIQQGLNVGYQQGAKAPTFMNDLFGGGSNRNYVNNMIDGYGNNINNARTNWPNDFNTGRADGPRHHGHHGHHYDKHFPRYDNPNDAFIDPNTLPNYITRKNIPNDGRFYA